VARAPRPPLGRLPPAPGSRGSYFQYFIKILKILILGQRGLIFSIFHQNIENIDPGGLPGEGWQGHQGLPWEGSHQPQDPGAHIFNISSKY